MQKPNPVSFNHLCMAAAFTAEAARLLHKPPDWAAGLSDAEVEHYVAQSIVRLVRAAREMGLVLPSFQKTATVAPRVKRRLPETPPSDNRRPGPNASHL